MKKIKYETWLRYATLATLMGLFGWERSPISFALFCLFILWHTEYQCLCDRTETTRKELDRLEDAFDDLFTRVGVNEDAIKKGTNGN